MTSRKKGSYTQPTSNRVTTADTLWFKNKMQDRRLYLKDIEARTSLSVSAMSRMMASKRNLSVPEAEQLAPVLGEPADVILFKAGMVGEDYLARAKATAPVESIVTHSVDGAGVMRKLKTAFRVAQTAQEGSVLAEVRAKVGPLSFMDSWILCVDESERPISECEGKTAFVKVGRTPAMVLIHPNRHGGFDLVSISGELLDEQTSAKTARRVLHAQPSE